MQSKTLRRTLVKCLAADGILGGLGQWRPSIWAIISPVHVFSRTEFDLFVGESPVNITGPPHFHDCQRRISWPSAAIAGFFGVRMRY